MRPNRHYKLLLLLLVPLIFSGCAEPRYAQIKNIYTTTGTTLVCFGNSLTAGQGAPRGTDYPSLLAQELPLPVINSGISGDTAAAAIARIDKDVLAHDPKVVIVELGANDILRSGGTKRALDKVFEDLETIIETIQEHGAVVVVAGISINYDIEQRYKKLAKTKKALLVPNIIGGILGDPQLASDSLHPNAAGYKIMAKRLFDALVPLLMEME